MLFAGLCLSEKGHYILCITNFYYLINWLFTWKNADSLRQQNIYHSHFSDCLIIYFTNICSGFKSTLKLFRFFLYLQLTMSSGTKNMLVQGLGVLTFWGNRVHEASGPACGRWYIDVWHKFDLLSTPQSRLRNLRVT